MKSAALLLIALALWGPVLANAQSSTSTPAQAWPKKVKLLQETRLDIQLGSVKASRKVPPNTEVDVLEVNLPNLVIRQNNATATIPIATTDFLKRETNLIVIQGGTLPEESEQAGTNVATFEIGKYEVTWDEWQKVRAWAMKNRYMDMRNVGAGSAGNHPVRDVSWYDVVKWCNARSEQLGLQPVYLHDGKVFRTGAEIPTPNSQANGFRLPTEAEWEWAARGGISSQGFIYSGSDDVNAVGWYWGNSAGALVDQSSGRGTWPVGLKQPDELGLHDMSGNVWEWCWDANGTDRRIRGGSWIRSPVCHAVADRGQVYGLVTRIHDIGFRLARNSDLERSGTTSVPEIAKNPAPLPEETHSSHTPVPPQNQVESYNTSPGPETLTSDEEREFFAACTNADTAKIKTMLANNPNLAKAVMVGKSHSGPFVINALQAMIDKTKKNPRRIEAIKALVEGGVDPKASTSKKSTSFARGLVSTPANLTPEELDYLLTQGADPYFGFCSGDFPPLLTLAANFAEAGTPSSRAENRELLKIFIKHGVDPDRKSDGWRSADSPMMVSEITGDMELAAILSGIEASTTFKTTPGLETLTSEEEKAYFAACMSADTKTIQSLLATNPALAKAVMVGKTFGRSPDGSNTTYPVAVIGIHAWIDQAKKRKSKRLAAMKALVEGGVDPKATTSPEFTGLARGTVTLPDQLNLKELEYLLSQGVDPNFGWSFKGYTPLMELASDFIHQKAALKRRKIEEKPKKVDWIRLYMAHGANPSKQAMGNYEIPGVLMLVPTQGGWKTDRPKVSSYNSATKFSEIVGDPELAAILAGKSSEH